MTHERRGKSDEWYTPKYVFDALGVVFDLDVAHPRDHSYTSVPARRFLYEYGLEAEWSGFIWMNPPFGNGDRAKLLWMERFFDNGDGVALTPDRTSAGWFQQCWQRADMVMFVSPKIKFVAPDGSRGEQPGNGTVLWAAGERGVQALCAAHERGLGQIARPIRTEAA
ncbi:DNA N-6-adenine-methyltransferase [Novosphingobium resinovorum]|uniref:Adenine methyltransferase n=1 Tax=Novosphingobium resinovorum TaxID=158500 RepID=A0A1D8A4Z8_9SPHN|nr:DNA N-6-adenine-methyltransferase [Novosphingobium resinovorum]AOR77185.1 hypothetical protein BES08_10815 [Novosphingobium resinovorum]